MLSYASTKVTIEMPFQETRFSEGGKQTNDSGGQRVEVVCFFDRP